jgi:hypothetical protein
MSCGEPLGFEAPVVSPEVYTAVQLSALILINWMTKLAMLGAQSAAGTMRASRPGRPRLGRDGEGRSAGGRATRRGISVPTSAQVTRCAVVSIGCGSFTDGSSCSVK